MKRLRVVSALLALTATLAFGIASKPSYASEEAAGKKCTCVYQSGSAGVIENNDCVVQDCWIPLPGGN
jgi:hypothetical protein